MVGAFVEVAAARGIEDIVLTTHDLVALTVTSEAMQPVCILDFVAEGGGAIAVLRAEDYPVLARVWDNDEDDDLFAAEPAL